MLKKQVELPSTTSLRFHFVHFLHALFCFVFLFFFLVAHFSVFWAFHPGVLQLLFSKPLCSFSPACQSNYTFSHVVAIGKPATLNLRSQAQSFLERISTTLNSSSVTHTIIETYAVSTTPNTSLCTKVNDLDQEFTKYGSVTIARGVRGDMTKTKTSRTY